MRSKYVETYQQPGGWYAETTDPAGACIGRGDTETAALAALCDELCEQMINTPAAYAYDP